MVRSVNGASCDCCGQRLPSFQVASKSRAPLWLRSGMHVRDASYLSLRLLAL